MKTSLFTLLLLLFATFQAFSATPLVVDHDLEILLQPEARQLEATDTLALPRPTSGELVLYLAPETELLAVGSDNARITTSYSAGRLSIRVQDQRPEPLVLQIRYRARFAATLPESAVGIEDPSFGVSAAIGPEGTYLSAGTGWFPRLADGLNTLTLRVAAPAGTFAVTDGRLIDHGTSADGSYTRWEATDPATGFALAAGQYQIAADQTGEIQILTFLSAQNAGLAPTYLEACKTYLELYQELLGPYPFAKFAVVENFLQTGYGLPSWTLLGRDVIRLPFIPATSLPHEIVHSWWGNAIEVDYAGGNWAEGLTTYLADYLLKERTSAAEARAYRRKILSEYAALVAPHQDFPLSHFQGRNNKLQQAVGYGKAAMVFHMLRQQIGDPAFWSALRRMAKATGQRLSWHDLESYFSQAAGVELSGYFDQWIERTGAPELSFAGVTAAATSVGWEVRGRVEQTLPVYALNLVLQLETIDGFIELPLELNGQSTSFAIPSPAPPKVLRGDPASDLFRRLDIAEQPATVNDLRASRDLLVVVNHRDDPLLEASADLLRGLHQQQAKIVTLDQLTPAQRSGHDLLYIGWPRQKDPSAAAFSDLAGASDRFVWDDTSYADPQDALLLVARPDPAGSRIVALFHPLSIAAARQVARKIPHYGRYSYLTFQKGHNLVKGTSEPPRSPLRVDFNPTRSQP